MTYFYDVTVILILAENIGHEWFNESKAGCE